LHGASFEVPKGTITALVGVNGSRQVDAVQGLMGFVPLASGEISILGQSVQRR
jgi:manganese/iron transport system ATP-binding protein